MTASDLVAAVRPVAEALEALGVPYYLTGSIASSAHGVARTSVDADIVTALDIRHIEPLIERLGSDYYIPVDRLVEPRAVVWSYASRASRRCSSRGRISGASLSSVSGASSRRT